MLWNRSQFQLDFVALVWAKLDYQEDLNKSKVRILCHCKRVSLYQKILVGTKKRVGGPVACNHFSMIKRTDCINARNWRFSIVKLFSPWFLGRKICFKDQELRIRKLKHYCCINIEKLYVILLNQTLPNNYGINSRKARHLVCVRVCPFLTKSTGWSN